MIKKYSVLICLTTSAILIFIATLLYPGGSILDKNSIGFHWSKNFLSNLFGRNAVNGSPNPGWIWALIGTAFHSAGSGVFFIHMSKKLPIATWATILKIIGIANLLLIFLIATPLHDVGVISIVLTLLGLFIITLFLLKSKLHLLKICCIVCLLTYYCFFTLFGFGYLGLTVIMQKVYIVSTMLLVLGLEYFTKHEDYLQVKLSRQKS
jgi:hypothetical protein